MARFEVDTAGLAGLISDEERIARRLSNIENDIDYIRNTISIKGASREYVRSLLRNASSRISDERRAVGYLKNALSQTVSCYQNTEGRITGEAAVVGKDHTINLGAEITQNTGAVNGSFSEIFPDELFFNGLMTILPVPISIMGILDACKDLKGDIDGIIDSFNDKAEDYLKKKGLYYDKSKSGYIDEDGKKKEYESEEEKEKSKLDKIGSGEFASKKKSVSVFEKAWEGQGEAGNWEASVDFLKAEAFANAYGGIYSIGADGEKHLMLGIGGAIGASAVVFEADASGELGSDMLGLYGEAGVSAGKVGAQLSGDAALFDKDGNFNPKLKVGGEAEAIAAEASVQGGVQVAGTKVGAKGSVNIGVGVHGDIGYSDGKFSFDVGASLGVGVSVSMEIDFSGTIDAVSDFCENAWENVTDWFSW